ncbi:hypothetical protein LCGC14_0723230 [marine sediment metagenome]|uniref:Uncharacterized protein n=1 Tax=marine sediment metagenome TaxID=412755 RepID=A0A0F9QWS5_9ZZZZ
MGGQRDARRLNYEGWTWHRKIQWAAAVSDGEFVSVAVAFMGKYGVTALIEALKYLSNGQFYGRFAILELLVIFIVEDRLPKVEKLKAIARIFHGHRGASVWK